MKEEYIKAINDLMPLCDDVSLLDLIYQLLNKSIIEKEVGENEC